MLRYQRAIDGPLSELVRAKNPLYNFILRYLLSPSGAEDLTHEAFLQSSIARRSFTHESRFPLLYTIALNLCIVTTVGKMKLLRHPSLDAPANGGRCPRVRCSMCCRTPDRGNVGRAASGPLMRHPIVVASEALP